MQLVGRDCVIEHGPPWPWYVNGCMDGGFRSRDAPLECEAGDGDTTSIVVVVPSDVHQPFAVDDDLAVLHRVWGA